jgi:hypothetical protein
MTLFYTRPIKHVIDRHNVVLAVLWCCLKEVYLVVEIVTVVKLKNIVIIW